MKIKIYKTIIFPVALHGCEAWSLILREERRLNLFENRILRRIFGPNRYANGKYIDFTMRNFICVYRSPNIVRVIKSRGLKWAGRVARMEEGRSALNMLTGTPAGKRPLGQY